MEIQPRGAHRQSTEKRGSPQERVGPGGPEEGEWLGEVERAEEALLAAQGRGLC